MENTPSLINQLPDDILMEIFFHLTGKDLCKKAILVCKKWHNLIDNDIFWIEKCQRDKRLTQKKLKVLRELGHVGISAKKFFFTYFQLFEENFLKNPCGNENFKYWYFCDQMQIQNLSKFDKKEIENLINIYKKKANNVNSSKWEIQGENQDAGSKLFFDKNNNKACKKFATTYMLGEKLQIVDLYDECLIARNLHEIQAKIQISEYYAARFDCGSVYNLNVFLINDEFEVIDEIGFDYRTEQWSDSEWKHVEHTFNVDKPIRYVLFYHSGVDTQFWAGFYGAKMTNGSIRILL